MSDSLRRGIWSTGTINKQATTKSGKTGARPANVLQEGVSNSEHILINRTTDGSASIPSEISDIRKEQLIRATEIRPGTNKTAGPLLVNSNSFKRSQEIKNQFLKTAGMSVPSSARLNPSVGGSVRQAPEIYSPLFQIANLQLPRDRITMNAWNRNFYDTHPLVHNLINLHATYPINKINIKCKDRRIENFFNDMIDDIDLVQILQNVALEFFKLGETFPYAELDETKGTWKNITIQNPDYIHVKTSVVSGQPVISMRPDAALQRLVQSNNPADIQLRKQISEEVLFHIRKGNNIPLDNFHVSHLKLLSSPYDTHGTSIIVSIYKDLMLYDKLRESKFAQADNLVNPITLVKIGGAQEGEFHPTSDDLEQWRQTMECYSEDTEVMTDQGFKKYNDVIEIKNGGAVCKDGIKIACFNPENENIEYHIPSAAHLSNYSGDMYHFNGKKIDVLVTPNHRMFVDSFNTKCRKKGWKNEWSFETADNVFVSPRKFRFRSEIKWSGEDIKDVKVLDKNVDIDIYLKYLGLVLSEGNIDTIDNRVNVYQTTKSVHLEYMKDIVNKFAASINKKCYENIRKIGQSEMWTGRIYSKDLANELKNEIGYRFNNKKVPRWVLNLPAEKLQLLLNSLVFGDGTVEKQKNGFGYSYYTSSRQLADDVYEIVYKTGNVPYVYHHNRGEGTNEEYIVNWSTSELGRFPAIMKQSMIQKVPYTGKVWCFTVPTGLFITRRNGKITIQGNSAQYDKDFKIISHGSVSIERIGASGAIIDISADMEFIMNNIFYGLMVPKAIITQEGAAFNSASLGLEVLKERYESFRDMMAQWLTKKIFAPISEIQEFYDYTGGEKKLIVPEIEWNRMILYDMDSYINTLKDLASQNRVSQTTLYKSLGLNMDQERRLIKEDLIKQTIIARELEIVQGLSLGALRALKPDQDIIEPTMEPLPGTVSGMGEEAGNIPGAMGPGGSLGMPPMGGGPGAMPPMGGAGGGGLLGGPGGGDLGLGMPSVGPMGAGAPGAITAPGVPGPTGAGTPPAGGGPGAATPPLGV